MCCNRIIELEYKKDIKKKKKARQQLENGHYRLCCQVKPRSEYKISDIVILRSTIQVSLSSTAINSTKKLMHYSIHVFATDITHLSDNP